MSSHVCPARMINAKIRGGYFVAITFLNEVEHKKHQQCLTHSINKLPTKFYFFSVQSFTFSKATNRAGVGFFCFIHT